MASGGVASLAAIAEVEADVVPISVSSEKELAREFELLEQSLSSQDWKKKITAMKRLEGLILGGCTQLDNFYTLFHEIKPLLAKQIADPRSALVREVSVLLGLLAKTIGDDFEPFTDYFVHPLLATTYVTIQIIADSGNFCIRTIILNSRINKATLHEILENCGSRRNMLKIRCAEYVLLLLECANPAWLERNLSSIEAAVKNLVIDALQEVRTTGRKCVSVMATHWESRARRLVSDFDPNTQKLLYEEMRNYGDDSNSGQTQPSPRNRVRAAQPAQPAQLAQPRTQVHSNAQDVPPIFPRNATSTSNLPRILSAPPSSGRDTSEHSTWALARDWTNMQREASKHSSSPGSSPPNTPDHSSAASNSSKNNSQLKISSSFDDGDSYTQPVRTGSARMEGGSSQDSARSIANRMPSAPSSRGVQQRVPLEQRPHAVSAVTSVSGTPSALSSKPTRNLQQQPQQLVAALTPLSSEPGPTPLRSPRQKEDPHYNSARSYSATKTTFTQEDLLRLLQHTSDPVWSTRQDSFVQLQQCFQATKTRIPDVVMLFDKLMAAFIDGLQDTHYKVVQSALSSLLEMIPIYQTNFENHLEKTLPSVFLRLADAKDGLRQLSSSVLERIGDSYPAETLLPTLLKVLDQQNSKIRLGCLEYMMHIISQAKSYLENPSHIRQCMLKLQGIAADLRNPDLQKAGTAALLALHNVHSEQFLSQVLALPITEQLNVKKALTPHLPDLESELISISRQKKSGASRGQSSPRQESLSPRQNDVEQKGAQPDYTARNAPDSNNIPIDLANRNGGFAAGPKSDPRHHNPTPDTAQPTQNAVVERVTSADSFGTNEPINENNIAQELKKFESAQKDPEKRRSRLQQIIKLAQDNNAVLWTQYFAKFLKIVMENMSDESPRVKEMALIVMKTLLVHQSAHFTQFSAPVLHEILKCFRDTQHEVRQAAEDCTQEVIFAVDAAQIIEVVSPIISAEEGPVQLASINLITKLVKFKRLDPQDLLRHLETLLPGIFNAFKSSSADIRKAVVLCLVEMYMTLGDQFKPYLGLLNTSQMKLVTIYVNRLAQQSQ